VLKQGRVQRVVLCQKAGSPFEIDRVPERDCRDNQVQPAGSMELVLEGAIADLAESVETAGPSHGVVCFALVEAGGHTARLSVGSLRHSNRSFSSMLAWKESHKIPTFSLSTSSQNRIASAVVFRKYVSNRFSGSRQTWTSYLFSSASSDW
jgi:hypothetical protein